VTTADLFSQRLLVTPFVMELHHFPRIGGSLALPPINEAR
jgi:hypothetical protein